MNNKAFDQVLSGSYLVAVGAGLWSIDSVFRSKLAGLYSPFFIIFITQCLCAFITLPICWIFKSEIKKFDFRDWRAFIFLAVASNILAMAAFTYAFSQTSNYSIPVLIQKLQPIITIFTSVVFLKEKLEKQYFLYSFIAILGSFLIGFGGTKNFNIEQHDILAILFSLIAAFLWGVGTTVGRFVSTRHSFWLVTAVRYALAVVFMFLLSPVFIELNIDRNKMITDAPKFIAMAFVPGLFALFIYYKGMQTTKASVACWLELSYPIVAVVVNWIFLGSTLNLLQIIGAAMLALSATLISATMAKD